MSMFGKRSVGLEIGTRVVRALVLEGTPQKPRITEAASAPITAGTDATATAQAIHAALAQARANGEAVVAAVDGPEVVVRQLTLPPIPVGRVAQVLTLQHREFGLLPPTEGLLDTQILRRSKSECSVLAVSVPRLLFDGRRRLLEQAAVKVRTLEAEPLALLNATNYLARPDPGELLVTLDFGDERAMLCFLSERGPVVVRYLDVGASALIDRLRRAGLPVPETRGPSKLPRDEGDNERTGEVCRDLIRRVADEVRMSLAYYRSEYDREGLPRYALSGWLRLGNLNLWLTDELKLEAPFDVLDPFQAVRMTASQGHTDESAGPEFVQAFGLALRGL